jgi:hypothetical protein
LSGRSAANTVSETAAPITRNVVDFIETLQIRVLDTHVDDAATVQESLKAILRKF